MQSFDTENQDSGSHSATRQILTACSVDDLPSGSSLTIELPEGRELALFHVDGEFYAINNFCPHKGAPLAEGKLCAHVIECDWHGWQFDVRSGECLTVTEKIETYEVVVEEGLVKIVY